MNNSKSELKNSLQQNIPIILVSIGIILLIVVMFVWYIGGTQEEFIIITIFLLFITILILFNGLLLMIQSVRNRIDKLEFMMRIKFPETNVISNNGIVVPAVRSVVLNNLEKRIINVLQEQKTTVTQSELKELCQLNKATLSLYLTSLEEKQLIKKIPKGRTNVIILAKEVKT